MEDGDDLVSPALELSGALRFYDRSDIDSVYVSEPREGGRGAAGRGWQGAPVEPDGRGRRRRGPGPTGHQGTGHGAGSPASAGSTKVSPTRSLSPEERVAGVWVAPRAPGRDPGTSGPRGASSPAAVGCIAAGRSVHDPRLSSAFGARTRPVPGRARFSRGASAGQEPELGRSRRAGPGTLVAAGEFRRQPPVFVCGLRMCLGSDAAFQLGSFQSPESRAGNTGLPVIQFPVARHCHHGGPKRGAGPDDLQLPGASPGLAGPGGAVNLLKSFRAAAFLRCAPCGFHIRLVRIPEVWGVGGGGGKGVGTANAAAAACPAREIAVLPVWPGHTAP